MSTLAAHDDFETYFRTLKPKTRKNMRNARNRLEREGALTHHVAETPARRSASSPAPSPAAPDASRDQGLTSRAFTDPDFATFCASLADRPDIDLLAMSLRHNDEPIAEQWGFVHPGRYYAFVASRDFEQSDESPGKLHLKEVIETCAARGVGTADLLVPTMPYKLTWATGVTPVSDYAVPLTLKGRLGIALWDQAPAPLGQAHRPRPAQRPARRADEGRRPGLNPELSLTPGRVPPITRPLRSGLTLNSRPGPAKV